MAQLELVKHIMDAISDNRTHEMHYRNICRVDVTVPKSLTQSKK